MMGRNDSGLRDGLLVDSAGVASEEVPADYDQEAGERVVPPAAPDLVRGKQAG